MSNPGQGIMFILVSQGCKLSGLLVYTYSISIEPEKKEQSTICCHLRVFTHFIGQASHLATLRVGREKNVAYTNIGSGSGGWNICEWPY